MGALYLPESKKNAKSEDAVIVFEDEASFRQTPTLHATQKAFGAVRLNDASFTYLHQQDHVHMGDLSALPGARCPPSIAATGSI